MSLGHGSCTVNTNPSIHIVVKFIQAQLSPVGNFPCREHAYFYLSSDWPFARFIVKNIPLDEYLRC